MDFRLKALFLPVFFTSTYLDILIRWFFSFLFCWGLAMPLVLSFVPCCKRNGFKGSLSTSSTFFFFFFVISLIWGPEKQKTGKKYKNCWTKDTMFFTLTICCIAHVQPGSDDSHICLQNEKKKKKKHWLTQQLPWYKKTGSKCHNERRIIHFTFIAKVILFKTKEHHETM